MNTEFELMFTPRGDRPMSLIAGPCSAESRRQVLEAARAVADAGACAFRAGVWKPRTNPDSFEGAGSVALPWLIEAQELTGLPAMTEVATSTHVAEALDAGLTALWIGARTTTNPFAVQEIADAIAAHSDPTPAVLVKNPVNPDLDLWIGAIERLRRAGVERIAAVHRGFGLYGDTHWRNAPLWRMPIEMKRRLSNIPIICDPSHISGDAALVPGLALQALTMQFDGLMIEVHPQPFNALSDARQQLTPEQFASLASNLANKAGAPTIDLATSDSESLEDLRSAIDLADDELLAVLARRMEISRRIGALKRCKSMPVVQPERYRRLIERRMADASSMGLNPDFIRTIFARIHEESVATQISQK